MLGYQAAMTKQRLADTIKAPKDILIQDDRTICAMAHNRLVFIKSLVPFYVVHKAAALSKNLVPDRDGVYGSGMPWTFGGNRRGRAARNMGHMEVVAVKLIVRVVIVASVTFRQNIRLIQC